MIKASAPQAGRLTVQDILEQKREALGLELLNPEVALSGAVTDADLSSPGLALSGFTTRFAEGRIQVLGETEVSFLASLEEPRARELFAGILQFKVPAVFVTKAQEIADYIVQIASDAGTPLLRSSLSTREFYRRLKPYLEGELAPRVHIHGSLADVHGVGLLFTGPSGVGKSECVLDLVERGHRLVADDLVIVSEEGNDVLIGKGHELQKHHMEIRGLGIVDIGALFGIRAIRQQKRIEVVVELEYWDSSKPYDRTGLKPKATEILGVSIPTVTVPLNPGKNITVISEVVAMNHLLKYTGTDSAALFNQHLQDAMSPVREYLEQDYE
jgi:HPr kinase/phosphorylase